MVILRDNEIAENVLDVKGEYIIWLAWKILNGCVHKALKF